MGFSEPSSGLPHYCSALTQNPIRHSRRVLAHSILRFSVQLSYSLAQASFSCCYDMPPHRSNSQYSSRSSNLEPKASGLCFSICSVLSLHSSLYSQYLSSLKSPPNSSTRPSRNFYLFL